jgi:hypothetical protein
MVQFILYSIWGFGWAWVSLNLAVWSTHHLGPLNNEIAIGFSLLLFVAAPLGLFLPRISATVALVSMLSIALKLFADFVLNPVGGFLDVLIVIGAIVLFCWPAFLAGYYLWRTRDEKWLVVRPWANRIPRLLLAFSPTATFLLLFETHVFWM